MSNRTFIIVTVALTVLFYGLRSVFAADGVVAPESGAVPFAADPSGEIWPEAPAEGGEFASYPATIDGLRDALAGWTWDEHGMATSGDGELMVQFTEDMGGVGAVVVKNGWPISDECLVRQVLGTSGYYTFEQVLEACPMLASTFDRR